MNKVTLIVRILLGVLLIVFGLNKFIGFMPMPEFSPAMGNFMSALSATGYLMNLVGAVEIIAGILILLNKYLPLGLVLIFPVMLNAFLAHLFLDIAGIPAAAVVLIMIVFLFFANKDRYEGILRA